jgi:hypothetical protein
MLNVAEITVSTTGERFLNNFKSIYKLDSYLKTDIAS